MVMRILGALVIATAWLAVAQAKAGASQDPTKTLPDNYKLVLDNDYVRVVRVHYGAGEKLADHMHAGGTTVYVYLNDSEGIVFQHSGGNNRAVARPAVKAGGMRISTGVEEHHSVQNPSATASDFLRIYLKTAEAGARNMRRIPPSEASFENSQIRVTRLKLEQHDVETIVAKTPALLVEWPSGENRWIDAGTSTTVENHDARDVNVIRIDFLTKPK